jgi:nucleotide-binding universal stress UspA family protein
VEKILCATRGGEASYPTQDAAIALAQERGAELVFLYVADVEFLNRTARGVRPDLVMIEMEKMGEFLLVMAQERARKQNVVASCILGRGRLREALMAAVRDQGATVVVLGQPAGAASTSALPDRTLFPKGAALTRLETFAAEIEAETGVEVYVL